MEKQKENPKSMNSYRKKEKVGFNVGGAGGIVVIGATVVAAAIGAAFLAYRDKRCSKQGADRTRENGIDEKTEKDLLDLGKLEGSSDNLVIYESVNPKNETTEDNSDHKDGEKIEIALEETGDCSTESNIEAMCLSEMIDQNKSSINEDFAFGSLIEIQETNPNIAKGESKRKSSYDRSTIDTETVKETVETSTVDTENNSSYDFSFWNNYLYKDKEIENVLEETSEKSEERSYDVFELEDKQSNGNTFVVTSEKSESGNCEQRVENMQIEKEIGGGKGGAFAYAGVEVEQNGTGDGRLFEEEETNKVNDIAIDGKENGKGEDTQSAQKETDEKDEGEEEEQGSVTYVEVEEKIAEKEEEISTQNEQRKGDDKGNTEGKDDDKDKRDGISYAELVEDEEANKASYTTNYENVKEAEKGEATPSALKETDEKDEYTEVKGNITHVEVEGKLAEKEEKIPHDEERKGDDSGNTEAEEDGKDNNIVLKETADSVTLIEVMKENGQKDIDCIQEKDNKVREDEEEEEEEHDDNSNRKVEEIAVKEGVHDEIRHVEEEEIVMEIDNQDKCRDNIEVEIKVVEKEENKREKGVDDDVDSSEENEKQKEDHIIIREELHEDMKPAKVMENEEKSEEHDGKLVLVEKIEDADIPTPIEVGEAESKNEAGNEIKLTEQGAFSTKSSVDLEIEKNKERAGSVCVEIEVEEQNTEGSIAFTEVGKGNKTDETYNVVQGQQNLKEEEDDDEIIRNDEIVDEEIAEKEEVASKAMIEENVEKIGVAIERLHEFGKENIRAENKDNMSKEIENDVEQHGVKASRDIPLSDEVNKELSHTAEEEGIKVNGEEGKERDDITRAEAGVLIAEKEHEDTPPVEGRNGIENEKEDAHRDDRSINVELESAELSGITNIKNNLEEEENKEDETANKELNVVESEEAKKEVVTREEEVKTVEEILNKNSEEKFNNMNKEIASEGFAAFQNDDNVENEDEENEDDTENEMKQEFADHSQIKNSNGMEDAECLVLAKKKKTSSMFMAHISKGMFLLVLAMSIAVVILSIFAQQDHLYYYYDHHLPHFCREIFQIFSPPINQTAEIQ